MAEEKRDRDARVVVVIRSDGGDEARLASTVADLASASVLENLEIRLAVPPEFVARARELLQPVGVSSHAAIVERDSGFAAVLMACREGVEGHDVVVLSPGVRLPYAWDARLAKAASAEERLAGVSPLCDASPMHVLVDPAYATRAPFATIDRAAYCLADRAIHEVPRMHAACAWLRAEALDACIESIGDAKDAPQALDRLARAWIESGFSVGLCEFLYVDASDARAIAYDSEPQDLGSRAFLLHRPYGRLLRSVNAALPQGLPGLSLPGLDAKPVVLHVTHYWGGGIDRWVRDIGDADTERNHIILATYRIGESGGQRIVLYADSRERVPVRVWDIARPIPATALRSLEYRRVLDEVVSDFCVDAVIVSSLIGHTLDVFELSLPTIVVGHDFYPLCESINPWMGETCKRCGGTAESCAVPGAPPMPFGDDFASVWPRVREGFVSAVNERKLPIVVPTQSAADLWRRLEPRLSVPMHVVGHGVEDPGAALAWSAPADGERMQLVVLGRIAPNKGEALLRAAAKGLGEFADVTLVGCGPGGLRLAEACGWDAIDQYVPGELRDILAEIAPHAAILASGVPETFSYTLTELQALAIPPLATRLGAFAERIVDRESGFLFDPRPEALVVLVAELHRAPDALARVAANLASAPRPRSREGMAADYHRVLPLPPKAVARFPVGARPATALTDSYEQLDRAYRDLSAAYDALRSAYEHTAEAYASRDQDYSQALAQLDAVRADLDAIKSRRWWLPR